jgi:hypothetical protein
VPLPEYPPALVQAPAWAGVGLRFRCRFASPDWPEDWWQRNYDTWEWETEVEPMSERQMKIPPAPAVVP